MTPNHHRRYSTEPFHHSYGWACGASIQMHKTILAILLFLFFTTSAGNISAQDRREIKAADTSSPRATLRSFIDACNELSEQIQTQRFYNRSEPDHHALGLRILDCIDQSQLPAFARETRAGEVATCLKEILDREEFPEWEDIPDEADIEAAGGYEKLSQWRMPGTRITIARVTEGLQKHEYLFSPGTVDRAVDHFANIRAEPPRTHGPETSPGLHHWYMSAPGHPALVWIYDLMPESMKRRRTLGLTTWKWPGVIIGMMLSVLGMTICYRAQIKWTKRAQSRSLFLYWLTLVFPILAMVITYLFETFTEKYLTVRGTALYALSFSSIFAGLLAAIIVIFAVTKRIAETIITSPKINPQGLNAQLIRICSQLASVFATAILFIVGGQYLGIPVATLLASAGIGGSTLR